jgi:hypothetical protein
MKIAFVLPGRTMTPVGGFKVRLRRDREANVPWFDLDAQVELPLATYPRVEELPRAESLIATMWVLGPTPDAEGRRPR